MFKYKKDVGTKDYVSEKLAADLGMLLNLPCAKIDIGKYKENDGSMSYLINEENESVSVASHPQEVLYVKVPFKVEKNDILRVPIS